MYAYNIMLWAMKPRSSSATDPNVADLGASCPLCPAWASDLADNAFLHYDAGDAAVALPVIFRCLLVSSGSALVSSIGLCQHLTVQSTRCLARQTAPFDDRASIDDLISVVMMHAVPGLPAMRSALCSSNTLKLSHTCCLAPPGTRQGRSLQRCHLPALQLHATSRQ